MPLPQQKEHRPLNVIVTALHLGSRGWHQALLNSTRDTFWRIWVVKVPSEPLEKAVNVLSPSPPPQLEDKMAIIITACFMFNGTYSLGNKWTNKKVTFPSTVDDKCLTYFRTLFLGSVRFQAARPDLPIMMLCLKRHRILRIITSALPTDSTPLKQLSGYLTVDPMEGFSVKPGLQPLACEIQPLMRKVAEKLHLCGPICVELALRDQIVHYIFIESLIKACDYEDIFSSHTFQFPFL